jgi:hypothetical protein
MWQVGYGGFSGAWRTSSPDGRPNERAWAQHEISEAVKHLGGAEWAKLRRALADRRNLTFLDRMHRQLAAAEPRAEDRVLPPEDALDLGGRQHVCQRQPLSQEEGACHDPEIDVVPLGMNSQRRHEKTVLGLLLSSQEGSNKDNGQGGPNPH